MTDKPHVNRRTVLALAGSGLATPRLGRSIAEIFDRRPPTAGIEWRADPVGIDTLRPRFHWEVAATDPDERSAAQTAYRLIVASDRRAALAGRGDIWDSGWQSADHPTAQPEAPLPLASHRRYW